jgi:tRNA modification GTPase
MQEPTQSVAVKLTGDLPAAIAVIEIQGPKVEAWLAAHWSPASKSQQLPLNAIRYGFLATLPTASNPDSRNAIGESVVVCKTKPNSVELHCHGGMVAATTIMNSLQAFGFDVLSQSQWSMRQTQDAITAQATLALQRAKTLKTTRILLEQQAGALRQAFLKIESLIARRETAQAIQAIHALERWSSLGMHLISPFTVILCGPPNVGKSSLLNRLLGYQRAIVHAQAGTTRDLLAEETSIGGWPVRLLDSAGIRHTEDEIEQAGVDRAERAFAQSDLILMLVDSSQGWTEDHQAIYHRILLAKERHTTSRMQSQCKLLYTKSDLLPLKNKTHSQTRLTPPIDKPEDMASVSSRTGQGIDELLHRIQLWMVPEEPNAGQGVPFHSDHVTQLENYRQRIKSIPS